jgi:hypothetical protein
MGNGESLDVELWRRNLYALDTLAHIPGDGYWAARPGRRTMLFDHIAEFFQDVCSRHGLFVWFGRSVRIEKCLQIRQALRGSY